MPGTQWMARDAWATLAAKGEAPEAFLRKQYVAAVATKADDDSRQIDFTISTGAIDRDRDIISPAGWKLANYKKNPVILWAHSYSTPPIGRAAKIRVEGDTLRARAEFAPAEVFPLAETVFQLIKGGFLRATSVGFRPLKYAYNAERGGMDFEQAELLEFSIVPVPANADCLMDAKSAGLDVEPLKAWAESVLKDLGHVWAPGADIAPPAEPKAPADTETKMPEMCGQMDQCMAEMDSAREYMTKARTRMDGMRGMMRDSDDMPMRAAPIGETKAGDSPPHVAPANAAADPIKTQLDAFAARLDALEATRAAGAGPADDDEICLALEDDDEDDDDEKSLSVDADELLAAMKTHVGRVVNEQVRAVVNAARGRVD